MLMVCEALFGPAARGSADLAEMRKEFGSFMLAHRILNQADFVVKCKIIFHALKPSWDYYTKEVTTILSAEDAFEARINTNQNPWYCTVVDHFRYCLGSIATLEKVGFKRSGADDILHQDQLVTDYFKLVCNLGGQRAWSALQSTIPPYCYASIGSSDLNVAHEAAGRMRADWESLQLLETKALADPFANQLLQDLFWARKKVIRFGGSPNYT